LDPNSISRFIKPAYVGDEIEATIELKSQRKKIFTLITTCQNKTTGEVLITGEAVVYHPTPE
jgi:acyl-CoA thioesterase FadM